MRLRRAFTIVLPALALLASGCGGGGGSDETTAPATTATTTALSKAQLIEQGDAICAEVNAAVGTVGSSSSETSAPTAQAASLYSGMVNSLKNLGAPQEAAGYPEFTAAAEALAKAEDEVKLASERGDSASLASAESSASTALSSFQATAQEYGFEDCSEGPKPPSAGAMSEPGEPGGAEAPESSEAEAVEEAPEAVEETPETPETGGAGGTAEGGGTGGGSEGGGSSGGSSGGIGPG